MKEKIKSVYYCDYCKKHGLSKHGMRMHEDICTKNPENNRPCFSCEHLEKKETKIYRDYYDGSEWERTVNILYCKKREVFLYTPINEAKGNQFDLAYDLNEPMPKECDFYEEIKAI